MLKHYVWGFSVLASLVCSTLATATSPGRCTPTGTCTAARRQALLCATTPQGIVVEICTDARGQAPLQDLDNNLTTFAAAITVPPYFRPPINHVNWSIDGTCGYSDDDITTRPGGAQVRNPGAGGTMGWLKGEYTRQAVVFNGNPTRGTRQGVVAMTFGPPMARSSEHDDDDDEPASSSSSPLPGQPTGPKKPVKGGPSSIALKIGSDLVFLDGPVLGPVCGGQAATIKQVAQSFRRTDSQGNQFQIDVTFDESGQVARVMKTLPNGEKVDVTGTGVALKKATLDLGDGPLPLKDLPDGTTILSGTDSW